MIRHLFWRHTGRLTLIGQLSAALLTIYANDLPAQAQLANTVAAGCRQASTPAITLRCVSYAGHWFAVADVDLRSQSITVTSTVDSSRQTLPVVANTFAAHGRKPLLVVNAGIYGDGNQPLGLLISPGPGAMHRVNTDRGQGNFFWDSAVFQISDDQTASIVAATAWRSNSHILTATQSGPQLANSGRVNPHIPSQSRSIFTRTAIGTDPANPHLVHLAVSREPVTLFELASFMVDAIHCSDALHLDGDLSAFYIPRTGKFIFSDPGKRIVTALIVTEKTEDTSPRERKR